MNVAEIINGPGEICPRVTASMNSLWVSQPYFHTTSFSTNGMITIPPPKQSVPTSLRRAVPRSEKKGFSDEERLKIVQEGGLEALHDKMEKKGLIPG